MNQIVPEFKMSAEPKDSLRTVVRDNSNRHLALSDDIIEELWDQEKKNILAKHPHFTDNHTVRAETYTIPIHRETWMICDDCDERYEVQNFESMSWLEAEQLFDMDILYALEMKFKDGAKSCPPDPRLCGRRTQKGSLCMRRTKLKDCGRHLPR